MQTIGEKIEETRKRKGISLSEAAEATKIRRDFLLNIESNKYDYDLPEIYKQGFIKNYAKYLKLNSDKVLSQYQEQLIAQSRKTKKSNTDFFTPNANLTQATDPETLDSLLEKPSLGKIDLNKPMETASEAPASDDSLLKKDLYVKTAIFSVSTLLFVFGIFWLIQTISQSINSNNNEIAKQSNLEAQISNSQSNEPSISTEYPIKEITLKASGSVYVQVQQKIDNKVLLIKPLIEGEIQTIKRRGPVDIAFTKGNFITLFTDGEVDTIQPNTTSAGKITLP